ncbi:hypothetical protein WMC41_00585 [Shinella yambaruensis]|uniref:hypothetical protein n=1 Tax=Shinella yambaruensis TaxID=415996 RepID=UPI003D78E81C
MHATLIKAACTGSAVFAEVEAAAKCLADAMERAHGGRWRIQIEHEHQFVTVARIRDRGPIKPKPEIV